MTWGYILYDDELLRIHVHYSTAYSLQPGLGIKGSFNFERKNLRGSVMNKQMSSKNNLRGSVVDNSCLCRCRCQVHNSFLLHDERPDCWWKVAWEWWLRGPNSHSIICNCTVTPFCVSPPSVLHLLQLTTDHFNSSTDSPSQNSSRLLFYLLYLSALQHCAVPVSTSVRATCSLWMIALY